MGLHVRSSLALPSALKKPSGWRLLRLRPRASASSPYNSARHSADTRQTVAIIILVIIIITIIIMGFIIIIKIVVIIIIKGTSLGDG